MNFAQRHLWPLGSKNICFLSGSFFFIQPHPLRLLSVLPMYLSSQDIRAYNVLMEKERHFGRGMNRRNTLAVTLAATVVALGALGVGHMTDSLPWQSDSSHESAEANNEKYHLHRNITATVFWVGEPGDASNDYIQNRSSFWMDNWMAAYGGVDDPQDRCGYAPCGFTPQENPFYAALPYAETSNGRLKPEAELRTIPWYDGTIEDGGSILKNKWVRIVNGDKVVYAQWEDVGPFGEDDNEYVFGDSKPSEPRAGIDLSPATADYLGIDGRGPVDWQFVDEIDVPDGPWRQTVTRSDPLYE
jgi:hypothetical protein